jgi:DNA-directed RNA polymerase subunit RPC12/RpoP
MTEAYVALVCPACNEEWEENPSDLPEPDTQFACEHCTERRHLADFLRTSRDLEIVESFQR